VQSKETYRLQCRIRQTTATSTATAISGITRNLPRGTGGLGNRSSQWDPGAEPQRGLALKPPEAEDTEYLTDKISEKIQHNKNW